MTWPFGLLRRKDKPVEQTKPLSLNDMLATSGTGWAAVIGGVMDVRTVSDSKNMCAYSAMMACGVYVINDCDDPDCDCKIRILQGFRPDVKLVPVKIEMSEG